MNHGKHGRHGKTTLYFRGVRVFRGFNNKYAHSGISVENRSNGGAWEFLGNYTQKPSYDDRPVAILDTPETRDYRIRWRDKDKANGEFSAVQSVVVGG
ncbi:MAG: hypothetical protein ACKN9T_04630 [Candidatus Methylumidiphilus sp.]